MSYILDALKKDKSGKSNDEELPDITSEHAYSELPEEKPLTRWVWPVVVMLLVLTIGILVFMLLNPSSYQFAKMIEKKVTEEPVLEKQPLKEVVTQDNLTSGETVAGDSTSPVITAKPLDVAVPVVTRKERPSQRDNFKQPETTNPSAYNNSGNSKTSQSSGVEKSDLPQMIYTTHIYATQPRDRFVMLNGRAFAEGDTVAQGLVLKEILENDIVVTYKGKEFVLPALQDVNIKN